MKKKHYMKLLESLELAKEITATLPELPESVKPSYLYVLNSVIDTDESMRIKDISEELTIASPNVTALVNEMSDMNLVTRETLPEDKRVTYIRPTEEGRNLLEKYYTNFHEAIMDSMDLKKKDINRTLQTLTHLKDIYEETAIKMNEQYKDEDA